MCAILCHKDSFFSRRTQKDILNCCNSLRFQRLIELLNSLVLRAWSHTAGAFKSSWPCLPMAARMVQTSFLDKSVFEKALALIEGRNRIVP